MYRKSLKSIAIISFLCLSIQFSVFSQDVHYEMKQKAKQLTKGINLTITGLSDKVKEYFINSKGELALLLMMMGANENETFDVTVFYEDGMGNVDINIKIPNKKYKFLFWPNMYAKGTLTIELSQIRYLDALEEYTVYIVGSSIDRKEGTNYISELKEFNYSISYKKEGKKEVVIFPAYIDYSKQIRFRDYGIYIDKNGNKEYFEDVDTNNENIRFTFGDQIGIDGKPSTYKKVIDFLDLK